MRKPFTRTRLIFLGAVLLAVAACSPEGSTPPATSPATTFSAPSSTPSTATTTASPAETPTIETVRPEINIPEPTMHPDMAHDSLDGADSAARYFLDLYGYVYETGDLTAWKKVSDPDCDKCNGVTELVEEYYASGQWFENFAMLHGESTIYYPTEEYPFYFVRLPVKMTDYTHYDATGEVIEQAKEFTYTNFGVGVQYIAPNEWRVIGATNGESTK